MAEERQVTPEEGTHVIQQGVKTDLGNGRTRYVGRHPQSPDHKITIETVRVNGKPQIMRRARDYAPMLEAVKASKKVEAEKKLTKDRSRSAQATQLAKKRLRTPAPNKKK